MDELEDTSSPDSYTDSWEESQVINTDTYDHNHESVVGNTTDFTFVAHGAKVSLYQQHYDSLEKREELPTVTTLDGTTFSPTGLMLHNDDR